MQFQVKVNNYEHRKQLVHILAETGYMVSVKHEEGNDPFVGDMWVRIASYTETIKYDQNTTTAAIWNPWASVYLLWADAGVMLSPLGKLCIAKYEDLRL